MKKGYKILLLFDLNSLLRTPVKEYERMGFEAKRGTAEGNAEDMGESFHITRSWRTNAK